MKIVVHNRKLYDSIDFYVDFFDEHVRAYILKQVHERGWEDEDCWSETIE